MELVTLFRFVEVLIDAPGGVTLEFLTDLPGDALAVRRSVPVPATSGRHPFRLALPGTAKGKLYQVRVTPVGASIARVYAAKVYARVLGPAATAWAWHAVPVIATANDWQAVKLPIEPTPEGWSEVKLPIEPTGDSWAEIKLPVPPAAEDWNAVKLPIEPTAEDWNGLKLPILPSSDDWAELALPIKPTPVVPEWVQVRADA